MTIEDNNRGNSVRVIGAGLAGCEAAYALASRGFSVELFEMKPLCRPAAHRTDGFCELVCSNSLKSARLGSAAGLLKEEMRRMGSVTLDAADGCRVDAGGALAVDREAFSEAVTAKIKGHAKISVITKEVAAIDAGRPTVVATGPLTGGELAGYLGEMTGGFLSFYDAAAPIVTADSLDMSELFAMNRYQPEGGDYLNAFFDREGYGAFWRELVAANTVKARDLDRNPGVYEGCMPIERLAARGEDTPRFGPLKPVGLLDPRTGRRPFAAVQLRKEDAAGRLYNLVGFQTGLTFPEQKRVFRMIPGLKNAEFARFGVMHRNSFIDAPKLLLPTLNLKKFPNVYIAGQLSGLEGYMESALGGILAARFLGAALGGARPLIPPAETISGALIRYLAAPNADFQPMGANMGLLPPLPVEIRDKKQRYAALAERSLSVLGEWLNS